jgi:hypothetical protein
MAAVGRGSHMVNQGDQAVLQAHPRLVRPSGKAVKIENKINNKLFFILLC